MVFHYATLRKIIDSIRLSHYNAGRPWGQHYDPNLSLQNEGMENKYEDDFFFLCRYKPVIIKVYHICWFNKWYRKNFGS